jgi:GNAT superfamily N-acetyltransferase
MQIRLAVPKDAMAVARVHVRTWQAAYRNLIPNDYLDQLSVEERAGRYDFTGVDPSKPRTIVAEESGLIIGFASTMPSREADLTKHGELCALYVDPEHWGHGFGASLVTAARRHLFTTGSLQAYLWILLGNDRAERFYRKDGWISDGVKKTDVVWGLTVEELRYQRELVDVS